MGANTFLQRLHEVLSAHPDGLSEFDLIKQLETSGEAGFESGCLANPLSLFQTHFLLFNALYQLADQLANHQAKQRNERLSIHTLCIQLVGADTPSGATELTTPDTMREYYLDLNNIENTDEAGVEKLLNQFWKRFVANDQRADALAALDLRDPVDWHTIKTQHRRLAMQHHPDRGGDEQQLQAINAAMTVLAQSHGKKH